MPRISKESNKGGKPASTGGLLAKGRAVTKTKDDFIKLTVYGQNRTGKTTLACTFPKPLALIAFEPGIGGGSTSVKLMEGVYLFHFTRDDIKEQMLEKDSDYPAFTLYDAEELVEELKQSDFKSLVIDSVTSLQDLVLYEIVGEAALRQLDWGTVSQDQYRQRAARTKEYIQMFLDLPMHVICTAKEKDHNPPKEERNKLTRGLQVESCFATDLGGSTAGWLHDKCDYIGRLYAANKIVKKEVKIGDKIRTKETDTGKKIRRLLTMLHPNFVAGFRSPVPENVPEYIDNPTFDKIQKAIKGERIKDAYYPQDEE